MKKSNFLLCLSLIIFATISFSREIAYGDTGAVEATLTFGSPATSGETSESQSIEDGSSTTDSNATSSETGNENGAINDSKENSKEGSLPSIEATLGVTKLPATGGHEYGVNQWLGAALLLGLFINNRKKKRGNCS